jgi:glycosyltransferase involved in cell wall biosynthesis
LSPADPPKAPRISVVTPSFNQGRFLEQCIASVLEQDYSDLEYIVIDGGSSDESVEVLRRHERHFAFWVSEPDNGQSDALNKGFRRATGDLAVWLNADDFFLPGAFAAVAAAYQQNPQASFYFGDGWRADETGRLVSRMFPEGRVCWKPDALRYGLDYILQPATFISLRRLVEIDYIDAGLHYGMDWDLWLRLARLADPVAVPICLAASREHGESKTAVGAFPRTEELRRIGEKHTGLLATPGAVLYYLDALRPSALQRPEVYPASFVEELDDFARAAQRLLSQWSAGADGFPFSDEADPQKPSWFLVLARGLRRLLRRLLRLLPSA